MKKLGIIIVNYNTKDILRKCLSHLQSLNRENINITVVDNGSDDASGEMVSSEFPEVGLIRSDNTGLAVGYNKGLLNTPGMDYYLFMGTDAFPDTGCIQGIMNFMDTHPEAGIATARLYLRDGTLDMDAHRGFPTPWAALAHFSKLSKFAPNSKLVNRYFMGGHPAKEPHEIDLCISHFMMVRKEVFENIGRWDEDYFVYGEDVDLCWRAKKAGYKIYYLPQFSCLHYKGVSVGIRKESSDISKADHNTRLRMKNESTKAMKLFYKKHFSGVYPDILNKLVLTSIDMLTFFRTRGS